ncbi:hypothetical protein J6590_089896 [Homalodisca vitripennis]|nr:hypothetical protein J6590_089896 [Homalodisca vitripennis]
MMDGAGDVRLSPLPSLQETLCLPIKPKIDKAEETPLKDRFDYLDFHEDLAYNLLSAKKDTENGDRDEPEKHTIITRPVSRWAPFPPVTLQTTASNPMPEWPKGGKSSRCRLSERTHNAGAVRHKACRSRPASMLPATGSPAAGENRVGNTKHLISAVRAHTVPAAGSRFQSTIVNLVASVTTSPAQPHRSEHVTMHLPENRQRVLLKICPKLAASFCYGPHVAAVPTFVCLFCYDPLWSPFCYIPVCSWLYDFTMFQAPSVQSVAEEPLTGVLVVTVECTGIASTN